MIELTPEIMLPEQFDQPAEGLVHRGDPIGAAPPQRATPRRHAAARIGAGAIGRSGALELHPESAPGLRPESSHRGGRHRADHSARAPTTRHPEIAGEAILRWGTARHRFAASEGAHADYAPVDAERTMLLGRLRERFGHVSYERVISGPGLRNVYDVRGVEEQSEGDTMREVLARRRGSAR